MKKVRDESFKITAPWSNIYDRQTKSGQGYCAGLYICTHGIVECTSEYDSKATFLRFAYKGRFYMRNINKSYSPKGLAIMAGKFVKEVINELNKQNETD